MIQLKVKSRRFAEKFNISMSRVLDKSPVKIREYKGYYIVRFKSKKFVEWWMKVLKEPDKKTLKEIALKIPRRLFTEETGFRRFLKHYKVLDWYSRCRE